MKRFALIFMIVVIPLMALKAFVPPALTATTITTASGKTIPLKLELAVTPRRRAIGLMHRKALDTSDGMAFFFPVPAVEKFWMKDTLIPLDILFVDEAGKIVYIVTAQPLDLTPVGPDSPIATVIELTGGRAKQSGIAIGDKVQYDIEKTPQALAR